MFLRQVNAVTGLLFSQHVMEHANQNNPDEQMKENEENKDDSSEQVSWWFVVKVYSRLNGAVKIVISAK